MSAPAAKLDAKKLAKQLLPTEHGSWAFVLEPMLIGWLARPGRAMDAMLFAGFLAFLAYRPAKLGLTDLARKKRYPRTVPALAVAAAAAAGIAACVWISLPAWASLWRYLAGVAVIGAAFYVFERRPTPRSLPRELAGACLMLPLATGALCLGTGFAPAVFGYLVARVVATVLSVRAVFRRTPDWKACQAIAIVAGLALIPAELALRRAASHPPIPTFAPVAARSVWLAATASVHREAKKVGIVESVVSLLCVVLWAARVAL